MAREIYFTFRAWLHIVSFRLICFPFIFDSSYFIWNGTWTFSVSVTIRQDVDKNVQIFEKMICGKRKKSNMRKATER